MTAGQQADQDAFDNIVLAYYRQNEFLKATPPFESVVRDQPDSLQPRYLLGLCYFFGERWKEAVVVRRERDGSVGLRDPRGAARAIAIELIEVRTRGPRGGVVWEPLPERAARTEQMKLL